MKKEKVLVSACLAGINCKYNGKNNENKKIIELIKNKDVIFEKKATDFAMIVQTLKLVNPLNILDKGYSLVKKEDKIIKDSNDIKIKDNLNIRLSKGEIKVEVKEIIIWKKLHLKVH